MEFNKFAVNYRDGQLILEAGFDTAISYTIRTENNGRSLILRVPDASYSNDIVNRTKIPPNDIMSGWTIRKKGGMLELEFRLTGSYSYTHTYPRPSVVRIEVYGAKKSVQSDNIPAAATRANPSGFLGRGIELYNSGRFDDALTEFNAEVNKNPRSPLSYYYAARIRLKKKQYNRAEENLLAALRDSSTFSDAYGLLAYTRLKNGKINESLSDWRTFVASVGALDGKQPVTVDSIMLPEEYRYQLNLKKEKQLAEERQKKEALQSRTDSLSAALSSNRPDTIPAGTAPDTLSGRNNAAEQGAAVGQEDFDALIRKDIRNGFYGLIGTVILLFGIISGAIIWIRKRTRRKIDLTFTREIERLLSERTEREEQFEENEERAVHEYETISREIAEIEGTTEGIEPEKPEPLESTSPIYSGTNFEEKAEPPALNPPAFESRAETITEEVKALVTRMFREGHSIAEIARTADLTQTEVELIVAVRARRMEQLIQEATSEEEDYMDSDQLYHAIFELQSEGSSPREIAQKLGISTSEVHMALTLKNKRKERKIR